MKNYTQEQISALKKSLNILREVQLKTSNGKEYQAIDEIMYPIRDIIDGFEEEENK